MYLRLFNCLEAVVVWLTVYHAVLLLAWFLWMPSPTTDFYWLLDLQIRDSLVPYVHACLLLGRAGKPALLGPDGLLETAKSSRAWLQQLQEYAGVARLQAASRSIENFELLLQDTKVRQLKVFQQVTQSQHVRLAVELISPAKWSAIPCAVCCCVVELELVLCAMQAWSLRCCSCCSGPTALRHAGQPWQRQ